MVPTDSKDRTSVWLIDNVRISESYLHCPNFGVATSGSTDYTLPPDGPSGARRIILGTESDGPAVESVAGLVPRGLIKASSCGFDCQRR